MNLSHVCLLEYPLGNRVFVLPQLGRDVIADRESTAWDAESRSRVNFAASSADSRGDDRGGTFPIRRRWTTRRDGGVARRRCNVWDPCISIACIRIIKRRVPRGYVPPAVCERAQRVHPRPRPRRIRWRRPRDAEKEAAENVDRTLEKQGQELEQRLVRLQRRRWRQKET